jgi:hypothetical protein
MKYYLKLANYHPGRAVDPDSLNPDPDPDPAFQVHPDTNPDPGLDDQKLKKKIKPNIFLSFYDQKLQFTYVQATREAFSPQKRTFSTSKNEIYKLFSMFVGNFCPPGSRQMRREEGKISF